MPDGKFVHNMEVKKDFKMFVLYSFALIYIFSFYGVKVSCRCTKEDSAFFVDCSNYNLTEIPRNLPKNRTMLDFNINKISTITERIFENMSTVIWIDLSNNKIFKIHRYSLIGLDKLENLNLSYNKLHISSFENGSFNAIKNLKDFRINDINFPQGADFPAEISHLKNLEFFETEAFIGMKFDNRFTTWKSLHTFRSVRSPYLILTNETFSGLRNCPLRQLTIKLRQAEPGSLVHVPNLKVVTLLFGVVASDKTVMEAFQMLSVFTNLTNISIQTDNSRDKLRLKMKFFKYIEHICLRELEIIGLYNDDIGSSGFAEIAMKCDCLQSFKLSLNFYPESVLLFLHLFKKLKYLSVESFHAPYLPHNTATKEVTRIYKFPKTLEQMELFNMELTFLTNTSTKILNADNFWKFTCKRCIFQKCHINVSGLEKVTFLDVSDSTCERTKTFNLGISPGNLESLIAPNSFLGRSLQDKQISQRLFSGFLNLKWINLSSNNLTENSIMELTFQDQYSSLLSINISLNKFKAIPFVLQNFKKIVNVDLSHNEISTINKPEREMLDNIWAHTSGILLHGNPFRCTCSNIDFLKWTKITRSVNLRSSYCEKANGERVTFSSMFETLDRFEKRCQEHVWLIFSLTSFSVFILSIIITMVYFRYKSAFQYFCLKLKLRIKKYEEINGDSYLYDVFICYNHHDSRWVASFNNKLTSRGYKTCLDAKDFIAGDDIAENILRAIDNSRKIIFVITENFLKSEWGNYEIEITRMHAFQEGRDNMVIVVLKDDISINRMPRALKRFWYKVTCIKYYENGKLPFQSDEIFYENIYNALYFTGM